MSNAISFERVTKIYNTGKLLTPVLSDISITIKQGEMVAIMGPSGSGKSTLMHMIGLLDRPTQGVLQLNGEPITLNMHDSKLARLRGQKIGFVFQSFNLLPRLNALSNVLLPTIYQKGSQRAQHKRALALLEQVGLSHRLDHIPSELSGGEKQRVAIARALINDPEIILADEPTGNLDTKSGQEIIELLRQLNKSGKTIVVITHDAKIAKECDRTIHLLDGHIMENNHV